MFAAKEENEKSTIEMSSSMELKKYKDILRQLDKDQESHLLLGNGFNLSLGIDTSYKNIFEEMQKEYPEYLHLEEILKVCNYDIELIIDKLVKTIESTDNDIHNFLTNCISRKIKYDFMKATLDIVTRKINRVYGEKNKDIDFLLKKFKNYFTLNYDYFLYLFLITYKNKYSSQDILAFPESDLNKLKEQEEEDYKKVQKIFEEATVSIIIEGKQIQSPLYGFSKLSFKNLVEGRLKQMSEKNMNKAIGRLWLEKDPENKEIPLHLPNKKQESRNNKSFTSSSFPDTTSFQYIDDGFRGSSTLTYEEELFWTQNLFFLHGAFHIIKQNTENVIIKIQKEANESLHTKLKEIIKQSNTNIVCVFGGENKKEQIKGNIYLEKALKKLSTLKGSLLIIGCSLSDNDSHIFDAINKSEISTIYISSQEKDKNKDFRKAEKFFTKKEIVLFDRKSISYEEQNENSSWIGNNLKEPTLHKK